MGGGGGVGSREGAARWPLDWPLCRTWGHRMRVTATGDGISLWGDENVLKVDNIDDSQFCEYTET